MKSIISAVVVNSVRAVTPFNIIALYDLVWSKLMLANYVSRNSHVTFSQAQQDLILGRLQEEQILTTFGPMGSNKTVCDFFLFFQNINITTALTARGWTKSGALLRWNYGSGKIYVQNSLPAQINNGVITVTSTDGFASVSAVSIIANDFSMYLPSFSTFTGLQTFFCGSNGLQGSVPSFAACALLTYFSISFNAFTGTAPALPNSTNIANYIISGNQLAGSTPTLPGNKNTNMLMDGNQFSVNGLDSFAKAMTALNVGNNQITTAELDELLAALDAYYAGANAMSANCTITMTGTNMAVPTGGQNNTNRLSLLSKATTAAVTWSILVKS